MTPACEETTDLSPASIAYRGGALYFTPSRARSGNPMERALDKKVLFTFLTACDQIAGFALTGRPMSLIAGSRHCQSVAMRSIGRLCIFIAPTLPRHDQEMDS
jgi:hypothetical protein